MSACPWLFLAPFLRTLQHGVTNGREWAFSVGALGIGPARCHRLSSRIGVLPLAAIYRYLGGVAWIAATCKE